MSVQSKNFSNTYTISFMTIVCIVCGSGLALLATLLKEPQAHAMELDRNKQIMIAAKLYHPDGYFLEPDGKGEFIPAQWDEKNKQLVPGTETDRATTHQLIQLSEARIQSRLVAEDGSLETFSQAKINEMEYLKENAKLGYADLPKKLIYLVTSNDLQDTSPIAYILPINGRGLWDGIYGYLAVDKDGETVIGTTWYKQSETAGLGANISLPVWQAQFYGKKIFQPASNGIIDPKVAPIGITVVKGKVKDILGTAPQGLAAVDGIAGSTLTGNGVTAAYKSSLTPYRLFFLKVHQAHNQSVPKK